MSLNGKANPIERTSGHLWAIEGHITVVVSLLNGDCRAVLSTLPDASVHCVVTSPPYWGLRDYGTAQWHGGDADCKHVKPHSMATSGLDGGKTTTLHNHYYRENCVCGAIRIDAQIGLEPTPAEYVATMVGVFREVRRVLRHDGTLWLNLGDSYSSGGRSSPQVAQNLSGPANPDEGSRRAPVVDGIKPKDLCGIPWRVAFALQADGWYLRQDIIWSKPNPMPESVTDRCTKAHEYIFLMSKSERYYYDQDAIAEPCSWGNGQRVVNVDTPKNGLLGLKPTREYGHQLGGGRNKRSVWEVSTQPFSQAHFATFPPALIKPCILAGCPAGGTVLDPFGGAGTTGLVADRLQRNAILIELNPQYAAMTERRIVDDAPLFAQFTALTA